MQQQTIDVMLVDDHKCILWGLEKLINSESPRMHVVGKAHNRDEAISTVRDVQPNIVLLDLDLNGQSSLDFLPDLLTNGDVRVLVLTGSRDDATRERAVMCGASGVVQKDEPAEQLIKAIQRVHEGELWLDRATTGKVFSAFASAKGQHQDPEAQNIASLTAKERHIVSAVVKENGGRNKVIADKLHMSDHTLRNHLTTIYSKLQVCGRMELYVYASARRHLLAIN